MDNHQQKPQRNKTAFVLGNGTSRLCIDVKSLAEHGTVYGCNGLYREYSPDHLVAVDVKMVNEIIAAGYHRKHPVWTNPNKGITEKTYLNIFNPHKGWSSGPTALWLACQHQHQSIYILGFDYQGLAGKLNNVYADTFNYKKSVDPATYYGNWLAQTERVIKEYKSTRFYRCVNPGDFQPSQLAADVVPNLSHLYYQDISKKFPGVVYNYENVQKQVI